MARLVAIILLLVALFTPLTVTATSAVEVTATGYTCDPHPDNVMAHAPGMCVTTAHGGLLDSPGMACPASWKGRVYYVPGYGRRICDDTPAAGEMYGRPHIDIRVPTYYEALVVGLGPRWIYQVEVTPGNRLKGTRKCNPYTGSC